MKLRITHKETAVLQQNVNDAEARVMKALQSGSGYLDEYKSDRGKARDILRDHLDPLIEPVLQALKEANGRAERHTIVSFHEVLDVAMEVEALLAKRGVTQKNRAGTVVEYRPGGPSKAYGYKATTTFIRLERTSSGWWLVAVESTTVSAGGSASRNIEVTEAAQSDIMRKAMDGLTLRQGTDASAAA